MPITIAKLPNISIDKLPAARKLAISCSKTNFFHPRKFFGCFWQDVFDFKQKNIVHLINLVDFKAFKLDWKGHPYQK